MNRRPAVTPGEILREEVLEPMGLSQYRLAKEIHVPARRIGKMDETVPSDRCQRRTS